MDDFTNRLAVVTGGGTGMGRELCVQLATAGAHVAMCDVDDEEMFQTKTMCEAANGDVRVTTHTADVSDEARVEAFRNGVADQHATDAIHLLFNNAGIGGGGSMIGDDRQVWDKTFNVCWGGVYHCTRSFLPMLLEADEGHVVNTSSVNGFWASLGPTTAHTAYSATKFAVKGFTEALIGDFRMNAPHLSAHVVMPGHIGTSIVLNSGRYHGRDPKDLTDDQVQEVREGIEQRGMDTSGFSDEDVRGFMLGMAEGFRDQAPMTAAQAATVILDGVRSGRWRILVGDDAQLLDEAVRRDPENAYTQGFIDAIREGSDGFFSFAQG